MTGLTPTKEQPMTQERLDAIQARLNRSTWTEGEPWDYAEDDFDGWCVVVLESGPGTAYVARGIEQGWDEGENDAALIAHAPQDLADLLAEVERRGALTTIDDDMVKRAAHAIAAHWHDMHTGGSLGRQEALAIAALEAAFNPREDA